MDKITVDEFLMNEEARVRRFAQRAQDRDSRARELVEIADRLRGLIGRRSDV